jgi:hypothetical protein
MAEYDYIVVGGGPTGITLATMLANTKYNTLLLESEPSLGGNWKIDWDNDTYLTEHSPKVLFTTNRLFFQLLDRIGYHSYTLNPVYGRFGNWKVVKKMWSELSFRDMAQMVRLLTKVQYDPNQTLEDWSKRTAKLSLSGDRFLRTMAIVMANTYDKVCVGAFVHFVTVDPGIFFNLVQLERPNEWIRCATDYLHEHVENVTIRSNTHVVSVHPANTNAQYEGQGSQGMVIDSQGRTYHGAKIVLATPLRAAYEIVRRSPHRLQTNWFGSIDKFKHFVDRSTYTGFGFQLHFDVSVPVPPDWCWSCFHDWTIIVVPKDRLHATISKDPKVKSVWSCVVVDLDTKSKRIGKTANECDTIEEVVDECMHQLQERSNDNLPKPYHVTVHKNIVRTDQRRWDSIHSSYANVMGSVPYRGTNTDNVFLVGPHNIGSLTIIEHAIRSAVRFGNDEGINNDVFREESSTTLYVLVVVLWIVLVLLVTMRKRRVGK